MEEQRPVSAPARSALRSIGAGLGYFGGYLLLQFVLGIPFTLIAAIGAVRAVGIADISALITEIYARVQGSAMLLTLLVNAATLAIILLAFRIRKKDAPAEIRLVRVPFARLLALIPLGLLLNVFVSSLLALLPAAWLVSYEEASAVVFGSGLNVCTALMVAVLAPLTEEVLFRGLVYTRFARGLPRGWAMAASALLFGVMHMQPVWIAYAALFGVLLCAVMDRYASLLAAIVLHMAFNAGSFFVLLLQNVSVVTLLPVSAALITGLLISIWRQTGAAGCGQARQRE